MKALTLVEILIVLALVLAVAAVSLPLAGNWSLSAKTDSAKFILEQNLRLARVRSQAYFKDQSHGLKLLPDGYVLFQGADYLSRQNEYDVPVVLDTGAALSWQLNGSGQADEIVFATSTGVPSRWGQITVSAGEAEAVVNVNAQGLIE